MWRGADRLASGRTDPASDSLWAGNLTDGAASRWPSHGWLNPNTGAAISGEERSANAEVSAMPIIFILVTLIIITKNNMIIGVNFMKKLLVFSILMISSLMFSEYKDIIGGFGIPFGSSLSSLYSTIGKKYNITRSTNSNKNFEPVFYTVNLSPVKNSMLQSIDVGLIQNKTVCVDVNIKSEYAINNDPLLNQLFKMFVNDYGTNNLVIKEFNLGKKFYYINYFWKEKSGVLLFEVMTYYLKKPNGNLTEVTNIMGYEYLERNYYENNIKNITNYMR